MIPRPFHSVPYCESQIFSLHPVSQYVKYVPIPEFSVPASRAAEAPLSHATIPTASRTGICSSAGDDGHPQHERRDYRYERNASLEFQKTNASGGQETPHSRRESCRGMSGRGVPQPRIAIAERATCHEKIMPATIAALAVHGSRQKEQPATPLSFYI